MGQSLKNNNNDEDKIAINKILIDIEKHTPLLLIGSAVTKFKEIYTGIINNVQNIEEVKDLNSYYLNIKYIDKILVIEDISFLSKQASRVLLKLVEEASYPIILLSRFDAVDSILLSRMSMVIKTINFKTVSLLLSLKEGYERYSEEVDRDTHYYSKIEIMGKFCPKLYYLESILSHRTNKEKMFKILI